MSTLKVIRRRIASVKSTQKITRAMQMVAAAKLHRAQMNIEKARPYTLKLRDTIASLVIRTDPNRHPLLAVREPEKTAIMIVTGDRGLCGSFNSNIIRKAEAAMQGGEELILVGKKGVEYFGKRGYNVAQKHSGIFRYLNFGNATAIGEMLNRYYCEQELDRVLLIYNEFKSAVQQYVVLEQLLPLKPAEIGEANPVEYIYEPSAAAVLDAILPLNLNMQIWRVLLESNAAEQGARMTAMENATDAAQEMIETLTLHYNKARQATITREIMDIVGGSIGME
ncbi:MAG: ATP synthase F1 subunit gamma [candidate division Zixibacteria bacterium]|nr:ATP synthase F1 subunit gamma [Candidatus Tariuqbacter arcticus]